MTTQIASASGRNPPAPIDALVLLDADHDAVAALFERFESTRSSAGKRALVAEICAALSVHARIEEEIFYPAVTRVLKDKGLVPEAIIEHASLNGLIETLDGVEPDGEMYDARVKVLSEYVKHHVKEEREEMFPQVEASSLDTMELGRRLATRKEELVAKAAKASRAA